MKALSLILLVFFVSCGSSEKEPREFKVNYEVVNASNRILPDWVEDADKYKNKKKKYRYFVSESENITKRLCLKSSEVRATSVIASEVVQGIQSNYSEVVRQGEDAEIESFFNETLKQMISVEVSGIRVVKQYWEKRKEKTSDDEEKIIKYSCYTLVSMSDKLMNRAIKIAREKTLENISDKSIKESLKKKFK